MIIIVKIDVSQLLHICYYYAKVRYVYFAFLNPALYACGIFSIRGFKSKNNFGNPSCSSVIKIVETQHLFCSQHC